MVIRATLGQTLSVTGDRDGAIAELREAVQLDPRFPGTRSQLARELLAAGRAEEALAEARQVVETNPDHLPGHGLLGLCLAATGHTTEARQILSELDGESERRFVSSLDRARVTAGLRDGEATLRYLEEAVDAREGSLPFLPTFHEFDFLQGNPRYAAILERIGVPANLRRQP
jgi:tetratricopeptide (TPR) repeat protein